MYEDWTDVDSSNIDAIRWADNTLWIRFKKRGDVYRYDGVTFDRVQLLAGYESPTAWLREVIEPASVGVKL